MSAIMFKKLKNGKITGHFQHIYLKIFKIATVNT